MLNMRYSLLRGGADKALISESSYRMAEREDVREKGATSTQWNPGKFLVTLSSPQFADAFPEKQVNAGSKTLTAYDESFFFGQWNLVNLLDSVNEFQAQQAYTLSHYQILYM